jgi:hypothetical protein
LLSRLGSRGRIGPFDTVTRRLMLIPPVILVTQRTVL